MSLIAASSIFMIEPLPNCFSICESAAAKCLRLVVIHLRVPLLYGCRHLRQVKAWANTGYCINEQYCEAVDAALSNFEENPLGDKTMAKVAFLGLGVMGYPMAGPPAEERRPRGDRLQPQPRPRPQQWAKEYGGKRAATPREAAKDCDFVHDVRRQRRRRALGRLWRQRRARRHEEGRDPRRPHDGFGHGCPRSLPKSERKGHRLRRCAGLRRPGRRGQRPARHHVRRRGGDLRQGEAGARRLRQDVRADRRARRRPAHQDGRTRSASPASRRASPKAVAFAKRNELDVGEGDRRSSPRARRSPGRWRTAGKQMDELEGRRLRLRHRVDAEGHGHLLPRPGAQVGRAPAGRAALVDQFWSRTRSARRQALGLAPPALPSSC